MMAEESVVNYYEVKRNRFSFVVFYLIDLEIWKYRI